MGGANGGSFLMRRVERSISSPECFFKLLMCLILTSCDDFLLFSNFPLVLVVGYCTKWYLFDLRSWLYSLCVFSISAWVHKETRGEAFSWCHHSWGVYSLCLYILCYLLCGSEMVYDYIIFSYLVHQFFSHWKHGLYVTTKIVRCIAIATYAAKLYSFVGV